MAMEKLIWRRKGGRRWKGRHRAWTGGTELCWEEGQVWDLELNVYGLKAMKGPSGQ